MNEVTRTLRHRINVSKTSTGKYAWDCTVELGAEVTGAEVMIDSKAAQIDTLKLSDALVAALEERYPTESKEAK